MSKKCKDLYRKNRNGRAPLTRRQWLKEALIKIDENQQLLAKAIKKGGLSE